MSEFPVSKFALTRLHIMQVIVVRVCSQHVLFGEVLGFRTLVPTKPYYTAYASGLSIPQVAGVLLGSRF